MPTETGMQTLQQERAAYALSQVKKILDEMDNKQNEKGKKEFRSYAAGFPPMIQINGLGQAAAFYCSQGETYKKLYDILSGWLSQERKLFGDKTDLLAGITAMDMQVYRVAQVEALLLLDWVKKFAKAYVRED